MVAAYCDGANIAGIPVIKMLYHANEIVSVNKGASQAICIFFTAM